MENQHTGSFARMLGKAVGPSAVLLFTFACATGVERFGSPLASDRVTSIQVGSTTRTEVLDLLGPPTFHSRVSSGGVEKSPQFVPAPGESILLWQYRERRERFWTAIFYTYFAQQTLTDTIMVVIDDRDVVRNVAVSQQTR